jgi:hypothetical protein
MTPCSYRSSNRHRNDCCCFTCKSPVQLGHQRRDVGCQLLAGQLGDGGEAEGGAAGGVERRRVVRQVHELCTELFDSDLFDFDFISWETPAADNPTGEGCVPQHVRSRCLCLKLRKLRTCGTEEKTEIAHLVHQVRLPQVVCQPCSSRRGLQ